MFFNCTSCHTSQFVQSPHGQDIRCEKCHALQPPPKSGNMTGPSISTDPHSFVARYSSNQTFSPPTSIPNSPNSNVPPSNMYSSIRSTEHPIGSPIHNRPSIQVPYYNSNGYPNQYSNSPSIRVNSITSSNTNSITGGNTNSITGGVANNSPSYSPGYNPSYNPSYAPSYSPNYSPSYNPGYNPSYNSNYPSNYPTNYPSSYPSSYPSNYSPSYNPSYNYGYMPSGNAPPQQSSHSQNREQYPSTSLEENGLYVSDDVEGKNSIQSISNNQSNMNSYKDQYGLSHLDRSQILSDEELARKLQQELNGPEPIDARVECNSCREKFSFDSIEFCDCPHAYCKPCLRNIIVKGMQEGLVNIQCPKCSQEFSQNIIRSMLTEAEYDSYLSNSFSKYLSLNPGNYTSCPKCHVRYEHVHQSRQELEEKLRAQGIPLTETKIHMEQNRFRCRECEIDFCARCEITPYHENFTCEGYKEYIASKKCRYCKEAIKGGECLNPECVEKEKHACKKIHSCNHPCGGIKDEAVCLPCLECNEKGGDFCTICYVETLDSAPSIQLSCSHIFHYHCLKEKISKGWPGARITFGFLNCPNCNTQISHPSLDDVMKKYTQLKEKVLDLSMKHMEYLNLMKSDAIVKKESRYYNNPREYAIQNLAYYQCGECGEPYYGGMRQCDQALGDGNEGFNPKELLCSKCSLKQMGGKDVCSKHGSDHLLYKCRFCCNFSTWFCWGTTHFCDSCHQQQVEQRNLANRDPSALPKCPGPGKCPVGGRHPPNGTEACVRCMLCPDVFPN